MVHAIYIVICSSWDRHAKMAWLSIQSLRVHEPQSRVTIVTDELSAPHVMSGGLRLADLADDVLVVPTEPVEPRLRAFRLKSLLRQYVSGDFVYLDVDTLVVRPLSGIMQIQADVAAALDFNHDGEWFPPALASPFGRLGFDYPLPYYFNSGVLFLRDVASTHALSGEWHRRWSLLVEEGVPGDQDAFVSALYASNVRWSILPKGYNAIVIKRNYRFRDARVLHFFGSEAEQQGTILAHLLAHLTTTGQFDDVAYRRCLKEGHPWGPGCQPWQLWHSRNYVRAMTLKLRQVVGVS